MNPSNLNPSFSSFLSRHIGLNEGEQKEILQSMGLSSLEELMGESLPATLPLQKSLSLDSHAPLSEQEMLQRLETMMSQNQQYECLMGLGFHPCVLPQVIQRNLLENPGWYTAYTPYQAEISQGRLECLLHFQTMICDLTGMELANASLLDEASAAVESHGHGFKHCPWFRPRAEKHG